VQEPISDNNRTASGLLTIRKPNQASGFLVEAAIRRVAAAFNVRVYSSNRSKQRETKIFRK
jgi:hypothetical protein